MFGPFFNEIPVLLFEYDYRFTEYKYEYEKNQWYELPSTIMPDGPFLFVCSNLLHAFRVAFVVWLLSLQTLAKDYTITPDQWPSALQENAKPGDRFLLQPGNYKTNKPIENLSGTPSDPIVITCSNSSDLPQLAAGSLVIRNCSHIVFERIRIDASELTTISISGDRPRGKPKSTGVCFRSVPVHGIILASNMQSISIEKCRFMRDTGWRWGNEVIQITGVGKAVVTETQIESRGMHNALIRVSDYSELEISRCKFAGNYQEAIAVSQSPSKRKPDVFEGSVIPSASFHANVFRGGEFAIRTFGDQAIDMSRNSFLNQKKGLLLSVERFTSESVPPTGVVFHENLLVHNSLEIPKVIESRGALQPNLDASKSIGNVWYCTDRRRLNPEHLGLWMFRESVYGVSPAANLMSGEEYLTDSEYDRIVNVFQRNQRLGWSVFVAYLLALGVLATIVLSSVRKSWGGSVQDFGKWNESRSVESRKIARPWTWIAVGLVSLYAAIRFAPFRVSKNNFFTIENYREYADSFDPQDSLKQLLFLGVIAGIVTCMFVWNLVLLRVAREKPGEGFGQYSIALILHFVLRVVFMGCVLWAIEWIDFYHFGGFTPPSTKRTYAIGFGCCLGMLVGLLVPRSFIKVFDVVRFPLGEIRWIDLTGLFGFAVAILYAWYPMELSLDPRAMLGKLNRETVLLVPFANGLDIPSLLIHLWHGILVGIGMSRLFYNSRHAARKTVAWSLLFFLFVEACKLALPPKLISTEHVLFALFGVVFSLYGIPIWKSTSKVLNLDGDPVGRDRAQRWIYGPSWVLLPVWLEFGWFYFWQITK